MPPKSVRSKATEQRLLPNVNRVTTAFLFTAMLRHTERHRRSGAVYKIQLADSAVSRKREPSAEQRRQAASRERGVSSDRYAPPHRKASLKLQSGTAVSTLRAEPRQDLAAFAAIVRTTSFTITAMPRQNKMRPRQTASLPRAHFGGDKGIRTPDLYVANVSRYQLCYIPVCNCCGIYALVLPKFAF